MSIGDVPAYAEQSDVQAAMQEASTAFSETPLGDTNVETAIKSASRWFRRRSKAHFYDSNAGSSDLISDSPLTATDIILSLPSSPHQQPGTLYKVGEGAYQQREYPVTQRGQYARAKAASGDAGLPYRYVESIDRLAVREVGGELTDWVADPNKQQGRGEDYYLEVNGNDDYGRSYVFVHRGSVGARFDFDGIIEADVTYGRDAQDTSWADVRRGVAHLAAAELVTDDDVLTQIPENATITNVTTAADQHINAAMDRYLAGYLKRSIA